jgi:hypothetical protein
MRFPGQLVFGQTLQELPRDGRLGFEFGEQGLGDGIGYDRFCYWHLIDPPWGICEAQVIMLSQVSKSRPGAPSFR